jgi:hypothetical protein
MPDKVLPFQDWRPQTPEEMSRSSFRWLRVSRHKMRPAKEPDAPPAEVISINPESTPELLPTPPRQSVTLPDSQAARPLSDASPADKVSLPSSDEAPQATSRQLIEAWDHYHVCRYREE